MLRSAVFVAMLSGAAVALADDDLPFTCSAEKTQLEINMRQSEERIDSAWIAENPVQKCAAVRQHIEVMRAAADVYARCTRGREHDKNLGQALGTVADFEDIAEEINCP